MLKKLWSVFVCLSFLLPACTAYGTENLPSMTRYDMAGETMHLSLPDGWYFNTPDQIDEEFLEVSENRAGRLKNYLDKNGIVFNLLSRDLSQEINIILKQITQSKLLFNFSTMEESSLMEQAELLISKENTPEGDKLSENSTYKSYELLKADPFIFMVFEGDMITEDGSADFVQYSTMVNGYALTMSMRTYDGGDFETSKTLMRQVVISLQVDKILEFDRKSAMIAEFGPAVLLFFALILVVAFLIVRHLKKK